MVRCNYPIFFILFIFLVSSCGVDIKKKEDISENAPEISVLNERIKNDPNQAELYHQRAKYYLEKKDFSSAQNDMVRALALDSNNAGYYLTLSDIYFAANKTGKAKESLEKSIGLDEKNIDALLKLAELYFYVQKNQSSIEFIDKVLLLDQYNSKAYFLKGMNFKETGDTTKAISSMQTAVEQDPEYYSAYIQLGILYASQKNNLALDYYNNALRINSGSIEAYYNKGKFYQDLHQWDKAIATYEELLLVDADYKFALYNLGIIYLVHFKKNDKALQYFDRAIIADPEYSQAYYARGVCYETIGNNIKASEDIKMAKKINPSLQIIN